MARRRRPQGQLFRERARGPIATPAQIERVLDVLTADGRWRKVKWLIKATGFRNRVVRAAVSQADGRVISNSSNGPNGGYRMTIRATDDEVHHAINSYYSREKALRLRALSTRRRWRERDL